MGLLKPRLHIKMGCSHVYLRKRLDKHSQHTLLFMALQTSFVKKIKSYDFGSKRGIPTSLVRHNTLLPAKPRK